MRKREINPLAKIIFFSVLYKLTIQWIYIELIATQYVYYGFQSDFDFIKCIISWLLFIPIPFLLNHFRKKETFSNQFVSIILFINYIPMLVIYIYMDMKCMPLFVLYYCILSIAVSFIPAIRLSAGDLEKRKILKSKDVITVIGIAASVLALFIWAYYSHFNIEIGFENVYEQRSEARNYSMPLIMRYMFFISRGIIPLLVIYNLHLKRKAAFIYYSVIQIIIFFIDGSKSVFFILVAGIGAYFVIKRWNKFILLIPSIFTTINILSILEKVLIGTTTITDIVIRRVMFVPCLLNSYYYDYFSMNGIDYYRQSLGAILGHSKYETSIPYLIGKAYFNSPDMAANNGLFSDAYSNLGIVGVIIMPVLIIIVLKLLEGAGSFLPQEVWTISAIQVSLAFISSSFFTVLLTHGVAFMIIMMYLLSSDQQKYYNVLQRNNC